MVYPRKPSLSEVFFCRPSQMARFPARIAFRSAVAPIPVAPEEFRKPQPLLVSKKVRQYTSNLYGSTPPICIAGPSWLLSLEERETQQYTSHLYCSTPPICTAVRLPFVRQYFWENTGGWGHRKVPEGVSDIFDFFLFRGRRRRRPRRWPGGPVFRKNKKGGGGFRGGGAGGGRGPEECLWGGGGGGLNIFFRGRNAHQEIGNDTKSLLTKKLFWNGSFGEITNFIRNALKKSFFPSQSPDLPLHHGLGPFRDHGLGRGQTMG